MKQKIITSMNIDGPSPRFQRERRIKKESIRDQFEEAWGQACGKGGFDILGIFGLQDNWKTR
jgi:hypothetical protein